MPAIVRSLDGQGIMVEKLILATPTLDDVFLKLTGKTLKVVERKDGQRGSAWGRSPGSRVEGADGPTAADGVSVILLYLFYRDGAHVRCNGDFGANKPPCPILSVSFRGKGGKALPPVRRILGHFKKGSTRTNRLPPCCPQFRLDLDHPILAQSPRTEA